MGYPFELCDWQDEIHKWAKDKGWWDDPDRNVFEILALIHSEVSEALEDARTGKMETYCEDDGKPCGFPSELADIVIRVCDLAEHLDINLHKEMRRKMEYNKGRPWRHGAKLA